MPNTLRAFIKLHEGKGDLVEVAPDSGEVFVLIYMGKETGSECAIGACFPVTGKFFVKDFQNELLVEKEVHLIAEGPLSALLFGGNAATIDGSATVVLAGAHKGRTYSGIAN